MVYSYMGGRDGSVGTAKVIHGESPVAGGRRGVADPRLDVPGAGPERAHVFADVDLDLQ